MSTYKYPYISGGKNMVAAVLGACQYIRETGYFNKAVSYYSSKYSVDRRELERNIRARQAAGQKGKKRKYYWYIVEEYNWCDAQIPCACQETFSRLSLRKATSEENACKCFGDETGSSWDNYHQEIAVGRYDTRDEALQDQRLWDDQYRCSKD